MEQKIDLISFLSRKKMSQADLSKALETTPANVNRWAKGDGAPGYELCVKLLQMGMTTKELFGIECPKNDAKEIDDLEKRVKEIIIKALSR